MQDNWQPIETAPKEGGRYIRVRQEVTYRWLPYSPKSEQYRKGVKGRWQRFTGWGFENAELTGVGWQPLPAYQEGA